MAQMIELFKLTYENKQAVTFEYKLNDDEVVTIVSAEENAHIDEVVDYIKGICLKFFAHRIDEMATKMAEK